MGQVAGAHWTFAVSRRRGLRVVNDDPKKPYEKGRQAGVDLRELTGSVMFRERLLAFLEDLT